MDVNILTIENNSSEQKVASRMIISKVSALLLSIKTFLFKGR